MKKERYTKKKRNANIENKRIKDGIWRKLKERKT